MRELRLSRVVDGMRLPLIYLVVVAHLIPFTLNEVIFPKTSNDLYIVISEIISHHLAKIPVRCFFLISGYFFFLKYTDDILAFGLSQFKSRLRTLIVPFLAWNFLMVVAILLKNFVFKTIGLASVSDVEFQHLTSHSWWSLLWLEPVNFPLWYIRDLICMFLIFPIIIYYIKFFKHYGIILLSVLYLVVFEFSVPGFGMTAIFFFTTGAYFSINKIDIVKLFDKVKILAFALMLLFLLISISQNGQVHQEYFTRTFIIAGVVSVINVFAFLEARSLLSKRLFGLSSLTFFIYVIHEIYIINWLKGFFYNLPIYQNGWVKIAFYFIIPFLCILICVVLFTVLQKALPRATAFILGGRLPNHHFTSKDAIELEIKIEAVKY